MLVNTFRTFDLTSLVFSLLLHCAFKSLNMNNFHRYRHASLAVASIFSVYLLFHLGDIGLPFSIFYNPGTAIRIKDCSMDVKISRLAKFWNETKFMDIGHRAKYAVRYLEQKGLLQKKNGIVVDIGAGYQKMRNELPDHIGYAPVDFVERIPGSKTSICNLNDNEFPFFRGKNVVAYTFLGSFEYILDKLLVLRLCRSRNVPVYMSYIFNGGSRTANFEWVTPLSYDSFSAAAEIAGYKITVHKFESTPTFGKPVTKNESRAVFRETSTAHIYLEPI